MTRHDLDLTAWQERCGHILEEIRRSEPFTPVDPADPWGATSLDALERTMLSTWDSDGDVPTDLRIRYEAFLGEGLRRRFGGTWLRLDPALLGDTTGTSPFGLGIAYAHTDTIDVVSSLVPQAFRTDTGTWWSTSFRVNEGLQSHES